jgi:cell division inhibitor SepF
MASMWRKAMLYLGLGPDEEYDDFDVTGEQARMSPRPVVRRPSEPARDHEPSGSVRTLTPSSGDDHPPTTNGNGGALAVAGAHDRDGREARPASRRSAGSGAGGGSGSGSGRARGGGAVVRPLPVGSTKPVVIGPASFNDAQEVADRFKVNVPVILNLQGVERDLARRIVDFASGLCYGLGGQMERVANQVYLLTPSDVEVSPEERRRLHERGYEA